MPERMNAAWFSFDPTELPNLAKFVSVTDLFEEMGGFAEPTSEVKLRTLCFNTSRCRNYVWGTYKTSVLALLFLKVHMPWDETKVALVGIDVTQEALAPTYLFFESQAEWEGFRDGALPSVILGGLGY